MSVENAIATALNSLVSNRVYPSVAVQNSAKPYIIYTNVSSVTDTTVCGSTEDAERLYQVDIYDLNHSDLRALRRQVFAALKALPQVESIDGWSSDYETDTRLHRCLLTVRCYEHAADL